MFSVNGTDAATPLANCVDGIDPLHQKFSLKANIAASFLINVFVSLAIYRDRKFITPRIIQDDSDTVQNPRFPKYQIYRMLLCNFLIGQSFLHLKIYIYLGKRGTIRVWLMWQFCPRLFCCLLGCISYICSQGQLVRTERHIILLKF